MAEVAAEAAEVALAVAEAAAAAAAAAAELALALSEAEVALAAAEANEQRQRQRPIRSRIARQEAIYNRAGYTTGYAVFAAMMVLYFVMHLLCAVIILRIPFAREEGIEGSSPTLIHDLNFLLIRHLNRLGLDKRPKPWVEVLSWLPRAFLYHNFLSLEETNYLRELSRSSSDELKYSEANLPPPGQPYNPKFAEGKYFRKSFSGVYTASLERGQYKVIRDIEKRMADFTLIPPEHGEGLEITHIHKDNSYYPHLDYFSNESDITNGGGQRIATMIIYLNDVGSGGEAIFPAAKGNFSSFPGRDQLSECAKEGGLAVKPNESDALFFWNVRPDGMPDPSSLHGHCRFLTGRGEVKMISVKRFRAHEHKI